MKILNAGIVTNTYNVSLVEWTQLLRFVILVALIMNLKSNVKVVMNKYKFNKNEFL